MMISFSCSRCGKAFSLKPPGGKIDGAPSSLARAGIEGGGVTLGNHDDDTSRSTSLGDLLDGRSNAGDRYVIEKELARGGMGAVMSAVDCDIRREVAVKYLLDQSSTVNKRRFVEEAQITGQLEHPNIVPIHELGVDDLSLLKGLKIVQLFISETSVKNLEPLRGLPLKTLHAKCNLLSDLGPLAGMNLETLELDNSAVEDLTPLRDMPLRTLSFTNCKKLHDLSPLAGMSVVSIQLPPEAEKVDALRAMKTLTSINGLPPSQFWKLWDAAKTKAK